MTELVDSLATADDGSLTATVYVTGEGKTEERIPTDAPVPKAWINIADVEVTEKGTLQLM